MLIFLDRFEVGADTNIESYPSGSADYSLMNGSAGDLVVNASNDRVQNTTTAGTRRARCLDPRMPTGDQQVTVTGLCTFSGNREQAAPLVRCHPTTDNCYLGRINASNLDVEILRVDSGIQTLLVGAARGLSEGVHTTRLKVWGNGTTVYLAVQADDTAVVTYQDTDVNRKLSGTPGFQLFNDVANDAWIDDFWVDDLLTRPIRLAGAPPYPRAVQFAPASLMER